jgi:hypothetical protein
MPPNPQEAECVGDIFSLNACGSDMPASRIELRKQLFCRLAIKLSLWYCYGDVDIIEPNRVLKLASMLGPVYDLWLFFQPKQRRTASFFAVVSCAKPAAAEDFRGEPDLAG